MVTTSSAERSPTPPLSPARLSFQEEKEEGENDSHSMEGMRNVLQSSCNKQQLCRKLSHPEPQLNPPVMQPKSSARVLISLENLEVLEEKEKEKEDGETKTERGTQKREGKEMSGKM